MIHSQEMTVDDVKYLTTHYSTENGWAIFLKLEKLLGEPLVAAVFSTLSGLTGDKKITEIDVKPDLVLPALRAFNTNLDVAANIQLIKDILKNTQIIEDDAKREINFNSDFAGRYGHMLKLLGEVLTFQFKDFFAPFAGIAAKFQRVIRLAEKETKTQKKADITAR